MQYPTETNLKTKIDSDISKKFSEDEQINKELEEEDLLIIQETDEKSGITYLSERGEQIIDKKYQKDIRKEETKDDLEEEFKKVLKILRKINFCFKFFWEFKVFLFLKKINLLWPFFQILVGT